MSSMLLKDRYASTKFGKADIPSNSIRPHLDSHNTFKFPKLVPKSLTQESKFKYFKRIS
jgi:hypothetical protein